MPWLEKIRGFDTELRIDGSHADSAGKNDLEFVEQLLALFKNSGDMMTDDVCQDRMRMKMKNKARSTTIPLPEGVDEFGEPLEEGETYGPPGLNPVPGQ